MLRSQSNLRVPPKIAGDRVGREVTNAVARVGNWVGGRFLLTPERLVFQTNALNRGFQADSSAVTICLGQVRRIETGRMLRFFKTLDLTTEDGLFRLRTGKRNRIALEVELRRRCRALVFD